MLTKANFRDSLYPDEHIGISIVHSRDSARRAFYLMDEILVKRFANHKILYKELCELRLSNYFEWRSILVFDILDFRSVELFGISSKRYLDEVSKLARNEMTVNYEG